MASNNNNRHMPDVPKVPAPAQPSPLPPEPDSEPETSPPSSDTPSGDHVPQPPLPVPPPYKGIRITLKEIFEGRPGAGRPASGKSSDKWDETCVQWCQQHRDARKDGKEPACKMVCFRRRVHEVTKGSDAGENKEKERWNPFRGYSIVVVDGKASCEDHVDDMNKHSMTKASGRDGQSVYEVDIGQQLEKAKAEGERLVIKTFTPIYLLTKRYITSWTDGTQAAFFERFAESVKRADAYYIVRNNAMKVYENAFKNSKRNDKDNNGKSNKS